MKIEKGASFDFLYYTQICEMLADIKLPLHEEYNIGWLTADYIFGYLTNRFRTRIKDVIKRCLGSFFLYPVEVDGIKEPFVFAFTGPERTDYLQSIRAVADQAPNHRLIIMNRNKLIPTIPNLYSIYIAARKIGRMVGSKSIGLDIAVSAYRAVAEAEYIFNKVGLDGTKRLVVFCDQWSIENALVQKCRQCGILTYTLQHGNGIEIFYPCSSDYYLANSNLSRKRAIACGVDERKIKVVEPFKFTGKEFSYKAIETIETVGVVLDGGSVESNRKLIGWCQSIAKGRGLICHIKLHPSSNLEDYTDSLDAISVVDGQLEAFAEGCDVFVACNSTYYQELIYQRKPVFRYRDVNNDWYPDVHGLTFLNLEELRALFDMLSDDKDTARSEQEHIYYQIFGENLMTYRDIFSEETPDE